jgi:hypothetical protein
MIVNDLNIDLVIVPAPLSIAEHATERKKPDHGSARAPAILLNLRVLLQPLQDVTLRVPAHSKADLARSRAGRYRKGWGRSRASPIDVGHGPKIFSRAVIGFWVRAPQRVHRQPPGRGVKGTIGRLVWGGAVEPVRSWLR